MPQQNLLNPATDTMRDLRITVSPPSTKQEHTQVVISIERGRQDAPMPVWVGSLPGIETDYLVTLCSEAISAWAYGETAKDVARACASVKKQAREHAYRHSF